MHRNHLSKRVGSIPIHTFFKKLQKPDISEGFDEVNEIHFNPGPFENEKDEETFY